VDFEYGIAPFAILCWLFEFFVLIRYSQYIRRDMILAQLETVVFEDNFIVQFLS